MAKRTNRMGRGLVVALAVALGLVVEGRCSMLEEGGLLNPRLVLYLIPDRYVGWVQVQYGVPNAPPLPVEDGGQLIQVPVNGVVQTSTKQVFSWEKDEYYYVSGTHRQLLKETPVGEDGMIWGGHTSGKPESNDPTLAKVPWTTASGFFVGTKVQFSEYWFLRSEPSKLEKKFYAFGMVCGDEDALHGLNEFADNPNAPRKPMIGAGKTQVYLAKLAGGIPGADRTKQSRTSDHRKLEAQKLLHLLTSASPYGQYREVLAFKTGYGIAQLKTRIKRQTEVKPP